MIPSKVILVDVGPRDDLRNEKMSCPPRSKSSSSIACKTLVLAGIDLDALVDAGQFISPQLGRSTNSRTAKALLAKRPLADTV